MTLIYLRPMGVFKSKSKMDYDYSVIETVSELEAPTGTKRLGFRSI